MAARAYARDAGIVGENFWTFLALLYGMDDEYLKYQAEQDETKRKKRD